jgi:hypothetical protein
MMGDISYLNPKVPRIRIITIPESGPDVPEWFLQELIDLILPVDTYVQSYKSHENWRGLLSSSTSLYEFRVKKEKVYNALLRKSRAAAEFIRNNPVFLQETFLRFNESSCEFLGSWRELKCEIACAK